MVTLLNSQVQKDRIHVVVCPESRCTACPSKSTTSYCTHFSSDVTGEGKILLVELERSLIHLLGSSGDALSYPPWYGGSWATVYIDSENLILLKWSIFIVERWNPFFQELISMKKSFGFIFDIGFNLTIFLPFIPLRNLSTVRFLVNKPA